jgi:hypothetical protein
MLKIMMGHWIGQTAAAIARFEIPDLLAKGPRSSDDLARTVGANPGSLRRLLRAAASVGIVDEVNAGMFANTPLGETLRKEAPGSLHDLVIAQLAPGHWLPWGRLYEAVKSGNSQARETLGMNAWDYYAKMPEEGACFARGMSNLSAIVAKELLSAYDFSPFSTIVDVGGSEGVMLAGALERAPNAKGILYELPETIERGRSRVASYGFGDRLESRAGDFFEEVPSGGDLYIMKAIVHDWDDEKALAILKNVQRAAVPQAKILIVEMVVPESVGAPPVHLMDLNVLVMLDGRERTAQEFADLVTLAGLRFDRVIPTQGLFSIIEATRS